MKGFPEATRCRRHNCFQREIATRICNDVTRAEDNSEEVCADVEVRTVPTSKHLIQRRQAAHPKKIGAKYVQQKPDQAVN